MNEYRCTRPACYTHPNCPGWADWTARQGHYVVAENSEEARRIMREDFPGETIDVDPRPTDTEVS